MSEDSSSDSERENTATDVFTGTPNTQKEVRNAVTSTESDPQAIKELKDEILEAMEEEDTKTKDKPLPSPPSTSNTQNSKEEKEKETEKEKEREKEKDKPKVPSKKPLLSSSSGSSIGTSEPQRSSQAQKEEPSTPSTPPSVNSNDNRTSKRAEVKKVANLNIKEGFLVKRGGRVKNWKTRWFVLKPDGYYYFDNPKEWRPKSIVPITEINSITEVSDAEKDALKVPDNIKYFFFFKIASTKRDFVCAATSIEERDDWITLGRNALENIKLASTASE